MNIADILIDRGEWAEAEALLLETLPRVEGVAVSLLPWPPASSISGACRCAWAASTRRWAASRRRRPTSCTSARSRTSRRSTRASRSAASRMGKPDAALELVRGTARRARASRTAWRGWCRCSSACRATRCCCRTTCGARATRWRRASPRRRERKDLFEATLTIAVADRARPAGRRRAAARDGERDANACSRAARSARFHRCRCRRASSLRKKKRPRRAASRLQLIELDRYGPVTLRSASSMMMFQI